MADEEARQIAADFERLGCYGDIDFCDVERVDLDKWAWRAYAVLWRLGQPESGWLTPSADLPACRDEVSLPDSPEYQHPEDDPHDYNHSTHPEDQDGPA